jgi:hypothetical protein
MSGVGRVSEMTRTGAARVDSSALKDVRLIARYVFAGKGAPEHCQIVLQLADHWKLAPSGLQAYADSALGLDCNGFVGPRAHRQRRAGLRSQYFIGKAVISHWQDMKPGRSYILGKLNDEGAIIEGGGSAVEPSGCL